MNRLFLSTTALGCLLLSTAGCGGSVEASHDEFEFVDNDRVLCDLPLGHFAIPLPVPVDVIDDGLGVRNRMVMEFDLFAEINKKGEARALDAAQRNAGRIRDRVIAACRSTPIEELNDPMLTAFKSHLIEVACPLVGGVGIEQLRIVNRQTKPL